MTHTILVTNKVAAQDNAYLNRSFTSGSNMDNGWVFNLQSQYTTADYTEVWQAVQPTTGSLGGLWMAASPEVVDTTSGNSTYRGIDPDPRNFYTAASAVGDAIKLMPGDIITLTADALDSSTPQAFANAGVDSFEFAWAANPGATTTMSLRYLKTSYISVGSGSAIGNQRVTAFVFEVLKN